MASLQAQLGDLATRARRFFRPSGSLAFDVPLQVQPVAVMANLDQDPYRAEPRSFIAGTTINANVGNASQLALRAAYGCCVVVDAIEIQGQAAAANYGLWLIRNSNDATYTIGTINGYSLNQAAPPSGVEANLFVNSQVAGANTIGASPLEGVQLSNQLWVPAGINTQFRYTLPEPIVLFGVPVEKANAIPARGQDELVLSAIALDVAVTAQFWGREYALVQGYP